MHQQTAAAARRGRLGYRPALDGIRAFAILAVLVFHAGSRSPLKGGFIGVDLFFVLSGFLITTLLLEEHQQTGRIRLSSFYLRRARRLLPALVVTVGLVGIIYLAYPRLDVGMGYVASVTSALFYASDFVIAFGHSPGLLGHTWSLAIEEQFYIVIPVTLIVLLRRGWARTRLSLLALLLACVSSVDRAVSWLAQRNWTHVYFRPDARADGLLLGVALAAFYGNDTGIARVRRVAAGPAAAVVGSVGLVLLGVELNEKRAAVYLGGLSIAVVCCALVVAHAVTADRSWLRRLLELSPLVWIGARSYGIYLYHFPVFEGIEGVAGRPGHARLPFEVRYALEVTISIAIAAASYRWVESRFLRRSRRARSAPPHVQASPADEVALESR